MSAQDAKRPPAYIEQDAEGRSDRFNFKSFLILQQQQNRRSSELLAVIDELDRRIAAGTGHRRTQIQARSNAAQEFAKHLDATPSPLRQLYFATDDGRCVFIVYEVMGNPSRTALKQAEEWMAARGQIWKGNSKRLRAVVLKALQNGDEIPPGYFGLRVERTIRIADEFADGFRVELPNCFQDK